MEDQQQELLSINTYVDMVNSDHASVQLEGVIGLRKRLSGIDESK